MIGQELPPRTDGLRYCLPIVLAIWSRWLRSCTTHVASSWLSVTSPKVGWMPDASEVVDGDERRRVVRGSTSRTSPKVFEQLGQRPALESREPRLAVDRFERVRAAIGEDRGGPVHPVGLFDVRHVTQRLDTATRCPGLRPTWSTPRAGPTAGRSVLPGCESERPCRVRERSPRRHRRTGVADLLATWLGRHRIIATVVESGEVRRLDL